jgi:hypothetical protein
MGQKVFLSCGHDANTYLVQRIKRDLKAASHAPWIDTSEIKSGDDWRRRILDGLHDTHCTLAFLSHHAVRENGVCLDEIALAMDTRHGNHAIALRKPQERELGTLTPPAWRARLATARRLRATVQVRDGTSAA